MSVVPSSYCAPEVDQEQFAGLDRAVGRARDAIMHDRAVRTGAGNRRERHLLEKAGVAAKRFQRRDRVDLGQLALRRLAIEPGEEIRDRRAVTHMRGVRAGDLGRVLDRLDQRDRVGAARDLAAGVRDQPRERVGGRRLVEPHGRLGGAERFQIVREGGRLAHVGERFEIVAHLVGQLAAVDVDRRPPLARHACEGKRQRRVRHVGAADVEGPGDIVRVGDDQRVALQLRDLGLDARELLLRALAGEFCVMHGRRGRAAGQGARSRRSRSGSARPGTSVAPAAAQAFDSFSAASAVCSQGS